MSASDRDANRNRPKRRIVVDGVYPQDATEPVRDAKDAAIENGSGIPGESVIMPEAPVRPVVEGAPPLIRVEKLSVRFRRNPVLRDIDLTVHRGETVAIIGESGCGKTVFLKSLIDLIGPNDLEARAGRVLFDGEDFFAMKPTQQTRQRIRFGFVFQQAALFDSMTVGENIGFPLEQHTDKSDEEIEGITRVLLAEVGLSANAASKYPGELSGGMRKRVGFARALAMSPEVMLYDEPTTGLDPIMSDVINDLMISTRSRHRVTGIMVTHDMKSAQKVADRIVMFYPLTKLRPGEPQVIFDGTPADLEHCSDPRVVQFLRGEARVQKMSQSMSGSILPAKNIVPGMASVENNVPEPPKQIESASGESSPVEVRTTEAAEVESVHAEQSHVEPPHVESVGIEIDHAIPTLGDPTSAESPQAESVHVETGSVDALHIDTSQVADLCVDLPQDVDALFESGSIVDLTPAGGPSFGKEIVGETTAEETLITGAPVEESMEDETEEPGETDKPENREPQGPPSTGSYKPKYPE